jgi:hypothetical protein
MPQEKPKCQFCQKDAAPDRPLLVLTSYLPTGYTVVTCPDCWELMSKPWGPLDDERMLRKKADMHWATREHVKSPDAEVVFIGPRPAVFENNDDQWQFFLVRAGALEETERRQD